MTKKEYILPLVDVINVATQEWMSITDFTGGTPSQNFAPERKDVF